jgi:hypothetical protein
MRSPVMVTAAFLATVLLVPLQQDSPSIPVGMFNPTAVLDASQVVDGRHVGPEEDEPDWACTTQGNRECSNGEGR